MAKKTTTIKALERRINNMSTKRRKRRVTRRRRPSSLSAPRKAHARRRRRRGFLHDRGGLMSAVKANGAGAIGGALFSAVEKFIPSAGTTKAPNPWVKLAVGFAGSILASNFLKAPNIGAGLAGATAYDFAKSSLPTLLHDGLEAVGYVDPSTLCDSGYIDSQGNAIVQDNDGILYALNDSGDLQAVGDAYDLNDGYSLQESIQSSAMIPLSDPYALSDRFDI